jgi:hypothetical protein
MKPTINRLRKTLTQICLLVPILCAVLVLGCESRQPACLSAPAASAAVPIAQATVSPVPTLAPPPVFSSPSEPGVIEVRVEAEVVPSAAQPEQRPHRRGVFRGRR